MDKKRIYRYDNVKALLIFLVVIGHMTTDYVSDSHMVRWITLWIYTFHMPAFVFISGLVHKQYITEENAAQGVRGATSLRWDKVAGFFLCGYGLKVFLQFTRTLMGQNPLWHWIAEPGIPWYLFVMAEYEMLFFVMRRIDGGGNKTGSGKKRPAIIIIGAFALSAAVGYFPIIGDTFCLSRMINFLPIYAIGYYLDMNKVNARLSGDTEQLLPGKREHGKGQNANRRKVTSLVLSWMVIIVTMAICYFGKWGLYSWRKWFTGRRSYLFLQDYFSYALKWGWLIRIAVWLFALLIAIAILRIIPDRDLGYVSVIGARTLQVYFWHRPVCYLFRTLKVLPGLAVLFGGTYNEAVAGQVKGLAFGGSAMSMAAALLVYALIGAAMTAFFSLKVFEHPTAELMKLGAKIAGAGKNS